MKLTGVSAWALRAFGDALAFALCAASYTTSGELTPQTIWHTQSAWIGILCAPVQGEDGMFYGTASGTSSSMGSIFRLTSVGGYATVTNFNGANGHGPAGSLLLASDGNFYGTTATGGTSDQGTLFRFNPATGFQTLYSFNATNGLVMPKYNLVQAGDGMLYGVTVGNIPKIFRSTIQGVVTTVTNVGSFNQILPNDGLVLGPDGWLYGTVAIELPAPDPMSSIFKVSTKGEFQTLAVFQSTNPIPVSWPRAGLTAGADGYLYGTLAAVLVRGVTNYGIVFRMSTNGQMSTVAVFDKTSDSGPMTRLLLAADGAFYGTTSTTVFRVTTNSELTTLARFSGTNVPGLRGTPLAQAREGWLYGVANSNPIIGSSINSPFFYRYVDPPVLGAAPAPGKGVTLSWNSFTDAVYRVQYKTNADDMGWASFPTNVSSSGTSASFYDDASDAGQRFYQVVLLP